MYWEIGKLIQYQQNFSSIFRMIKRKEQWIAFGKQAKRHLFFFEDKVLDLTHFMNEHPGGKKALGNYVFKDVTEIIFSVYPHKRETTIRKLNTYITGKIPSGDTKSSKIERSPTPNKEKEKKKVCFAKKGGLGASQKDINKNENAPSSKNQKENLSGQDSSRSSHKHTSEKKQRSKVKSKSKQKGHKSKQAKVVEEPASLTSLKTLSEDLDEEKPAFRVPILCVKHMGQLE